MPKVLCKLDNASELINDVRFVAHKKGMISEEISEEMAKRFASIPGYEVVAPPGDPNPGGGGRGRGGRGPKAGTDKPGTAPSGSTTTPPADGQPNGEGSGEGAGDPPPADPEDKGTEGEPR